MEQEIREELRQKQEALHRQQQEERRQQQQIPIMRPGGPQSLMPGMNSGGGLLPSPAGYPPGHPGPMGQGHPQGFMPMQGMGGMGLLGDKPPGQGQEQDMHPDLSRPPPGFAHQNTANLEIPRLPYFELPAGLMVPLVQVNSRSWSLVIPLVDVALTSSWFRLSKRSD